MHFYHVSSIFASQVFSVHSTPRIFGERSGPETLGLRRCVTKVLLEQIVFIYLNKRPMGHIAHLRKQFTSINTYDYIITLTKKRKKKYTLYDNLLFFHLNPHPRMLCAKIGSVVLEKRFFLILSMYFR